MGAAEDKRRETRLRTYVPTSCLPHVRLHAVATAVDKYVWHALVRAMIRESHSETPRRLLLLHRLVAIHTRGHENRGVKAVLGPVMLSSPKPWSYRLYFLASRKSERVLPRIHPCPRFETA
jgi:hypothetical protein